MKDIYNKQYDLYFLYVLDVVKSIKVNKPLKRKGLLSLYGVLVIMYALIDVLFFTITLSILLIILFLVLLAYDSYFIYRSKSRKKVMNDYLKTIGCRLGGGSFIVVEETGEVVQLDHLRNVVSKNLK